MDNLVCHSSPLISIPNGSIFAVHDIDGIADVQTYALTVSEYNPNTGTWQPFHLDTAANPSWAFQLNFVMLDPYVRTALHEITALEGKEEATYGVEFRAPDRHGVFKFMVDWYRPGYVSSFSCKRLLSKSRGGGEMSPAWSRRTDSR
jgi:hypothetical protein